jgi:hypothetical protein
MNLDVNSELTPIRLRMYQTPIIGNLEIVSKAGTLPFSVQTHSFPDA